MESEEPTLTMVAAPPPTVESRKSMIAHGWMEVGSEDVKSSGTRIQVLDSVDEPEQVRRVMVSCESDEDYQDAAKYADIGVILLAEDSDPSDSNALAAKARAQYRAGDFTAAKIMFLEAEKCDQLAPGRFQHTNNLSACMLRLKDYEGVLEQTERVLGVDPANPKAMCRRWLALKSLGEEVDSALLLSRLSLSDDFNGQADVHRSAVAAVEEKRQEQCDELRKRGNEMVLKDQQESAVELYTAALKENPLDVAAANNRAQAYLNLKRYADAEQDTTVVLGVEPTNMKARYRRGRARLNLPQPDREGGCKDLARVVSENPKSQNEAINLLAEAVQGMDLDNDDGEVLPEEDNSSNMPKEEKAKSNDETSSGDGSSAFEEMAVQNKEVILEPSTGAHPQAKRRPGSLMIVEDDDGGGCSWCPVVVEDREEDRQAAAVVCWKEGEQLRSGENWGQALDVYARGVVVNPSNAKCWIGISRVHRELGNYLKSEEAATRVQNTAPACALLCKAVTHLVKSNQLTQEECVQYVGDVMHELEGLPGNGTGGNNTEEADCAEEWGILNSILPLAETEARH